MNWIEKMIAEKCPNGVERVKLNTLLDYEQPTPYIVKSTEYSDEYETPVLTAGASFCLGYTNETDGKYKANEENPVIIFDDFTTSFHWVEFDFKVKSSAMKMLRPKKNNVSFRYIYFCMCCIDYIPVEHSRQWIGRYSNFEIPLPPLSIQKEIVSVLDKFSELIEKTDEEIALRQKQYEYYREKLLTFEDGEVEWKKLGDVFDVQNGYTPSKSEKSFWENGVIPWFRLEDIRINGRKLTDAIQHITPSAVKKSGVFKAGSIIISTTATIGEYALVDCDFVCNQQITCLTPRSNNTNRHFFLHYSALIGEWCRKNVSGVGLAILPSSKLKECPIPLPSPSRQQKIVDTLDKFEALISKLKEERELRQKQYEYYREKLLTF